MKKIIGSLLILFTCWSCSKESFNPPGTASVIIANALLDTAYRSLFPVSYLLEEGATPSPSGSAVQKGQYMEYGSQTGHKKLYLYKVGNDNVVRPAELVTEVDLHLPVGYMGSLFIAGTLKEPDMVLIQDQPVYFPAADSAMGIRFMNLTQNKIPISVNLKNAPAGSEVTELTYKSATSFMKYAATASVSTYQFEFRDAESGQLLASYYVNGINNPGVAGNPNTWRYKNITLVLGGLPGSAITPPTAMLIRNY